MSHEFESVYRTHVDAVFRYALRLVGNRELAEDITSEAFVELFHHWSEVELDRLPGWLLTVARNRALDYWRKTASERRYAECAEEPVTSQPALDFESWIAREPSLKPVHRTCLILHFVHGMTRTEVGERLGLSEVKVKGHLQYAVQLLRKAWQSARTGAKA